MKLVIQIILVVMMQKKEFNKSNRNLSRNCLLINVNFLFNKALNNNVLELISLVQSLNWNIIEVVNIKRKIPNYKYFVGETFLNKVKKTLRNNLIDQIIINHEVTASQERNIKNFLCCDIIDRNQLIVEIFASRAKTHEGKLQVKLAKLQYLSTRLVRHWTHLERQKGGTNLRSGPGEKQIELDRRILNGKIKNIERKLDKVIKQRNLSRSFRKRNNIPIVAFVGYTNAGKSTLFNKISNSNVLERNQLFSTLDPVLRSTVIPKLGKILISDTVGFIQNLPHHLIKAFRSTLEELKEADLLINVIDYSNKDYHLHVEQVNETLEKIGLQNQSMLFVYNKIDKMKNIDSHVNENSIYLSANTNQGINHLKSAIANFFNKEWMKGILTLDITQIKIRANLYEMGVVEDEFQDGSGHYRLLIHISKKDFDNISCKNKLELIKNFSQYSVLN